MKISFDFSELGLMASQMGSGVEFKLVSNFKFEPIDLELKDGLEIEIGKVDSLGGLLSIKGRQVVLYIKDHTQKFEETLSNPQRGYKFHIAHCYALESMKRKNRFARYHVTNGLGNGFQIASSKHPGQEPEVNLWVCQYCLSLLNYKSSRESSQKRKQNAKEFDRKEFFATYSSVFRYMPSAFADAPVGYSDDWEAVSRQLRRQSNYTCESCRVELGSHKHLCHVHHINGVKSDNAPQNLQVLCADCHRKQHGGALYVSHVNMATITRLRKEQNTSPIGDWSDVYELADPAVIGELILLENEGYNPPEIGYDVADLHGEVVFSLEAAWPDRKIGVAVCLPENPLPALDGWQLYQFGDLAKLIPG